MKKFTAQLIKIAHYVLLQEDDGTTRRLSHEDLAIALPIYKKMKPFIQKNTTTFEDGRTASVYQYRDGEMELDETEIPFLIEQLKRPFDLESAEVAEELKELLSN